MSSNKATLKFGLVICSKNEEGCIGEIIDAALQNMDKDDIFVVDGHSSDRTALIAREKGIKVILDENKGKGSGIRIAAEKIERDILIFMDSDGSHNCNEIPYFIEYFIKNDVDMIIGSRFMGGSDELYGSWSEIVRLMGNKIGTWLVNLRWNTRLTDIQNGYRAAKRSVLREINLIEDSFAIEQEMVMKSLKRKKKIMEIPSWELKRKYKKSHIKFSHMFPKYIKSFIDNL